MKKVLVTGASGFIGNYVVEELLKAHYKVIATSSNYKTVENKTWIKEVEYIPFNFPDYTDTTDYFKYFEEPDLMIHLAWEGLPNYKALFHFEDNLPRHYSLLKNMITNGLKDLSITGTCFEYGFAEGCLTEEMKATPTNPYAIGKDCLQKFLLELQKFFPFSFKWIRLFYMYGEGQNQKSLFSQLDKAIEEGQDSFNMSGGEQVRDYLPVEQVATFVKAIATQQVVTGVINCCSGQPVKLKDMVLAYLKIKKASIKLNLRYYPYLDYEPMEFWGDDSKLKRILSNKSF